MPYICRNPEVYESQYKGESHECVAFVKFVANAPQTPLWRPGAPVLGNADIERRQHLAQPRNRRAHSVGLDHRDCRVGDGGAARQLALRQAGPEPQRAQLLSRRQFAIGTVHAFSI